MKTPIFSKGDIIAYKAEQTGRCKLNRENRYKVLDVYQVDGFGNTWFLQVQGHAGNASKTFISSAAPSTTFAESGWNLIEKAVEAVKFPEGTLVTYEYGGYHNFDNVYRCGETKMENGVQKTRIICIQDRNGPIKTPIDCSFYPADRLRPYVKPFVATFAPGTKVKYKYNASTIYTIGESKLDDSGKEVAQLIDGQLKFGFYSVSDMTSAEPTIGVGGPKKGDRIEVSLTATVRDESSNGLLLESEASGAFYIANADINGRPVVIKPKSPPWKMGEKVTHLRRTYHVQALLTNDWCVLLAEGSTADFKLAHKNDPSFTRS